MFIYILFCFLYVLVLKIIYIWRFKNKSTISCFNNSNQPLAINAKTKQNPVSFPVTIISDEMCIKRNKLEILPSAQASSTKMALKWDDLFMVHIWKRNHKVWKYLSHLLNEIQIFGYHLIETELIKSSALGEGSYFLSWRYLFSWELMFSCEMNPFWKRVLLKKEWACLPVSNFFPFNADPVDKGGKTFKKQLPLLQVYSSPLMKEIFWLIYISWEKHKTKKIQE